MSSTIHYHSLSFRAFFWRIINLTLFILFFFSFLLSFFLLHSLFSFFFFFVNHFYSMLLRNNEKLLPNAAKWWRHSLIHFFSHHVFRDACRKICCDKMINGSNHLSRFSFFSFTVFFFRVHSVIFFSFCFVSLTTIDGTAEAKFRRIIHVILNCEKKIFLFCIFIFILVVCKYLCFVPCLFQHHPLKLNQKHFFMCALFGHEPHTHIKCIKTTLNETNGNRLLSPNKQAAEIIAKKNGDSHYRTRNMLMYLLKYSSVTLKLI